MVKLISMFAVAIVPFFFSNFTNAVIDLLNTIISMLGPASVHVIGLFPPNPCLSLIASCGDVTALSTVSSPMLTTMISTIAWLFPVDFLITLVGCAMMAVMSYFIMAPLARWLKLLT